MHFLSLAFFAFAVTVRAVTLSGYEYVVVGSGAGGGVVAARLAVLGHKVLLIEAGDDQGDNIKYQVPGFHGLSTEDPTMRWDYYVNHYSTAARAASDDKMNYDLPNGGIYTGKSPPAGAKPKGILYPRAGTLGGCGSHNALITIYPHDSDWSYIQQLTGDSSWSPDNMRKYFSLLENCQYAPNSIVGHGFSGWFGVNRAELSLALNDSKIVSQLIAAAAAMGQGLLGTLLSGVTNLVKVLAADVNSGLPGRDTLQGLFQIPLAMTGTRRNGPRDFVYSTANAKNPDGSRKYQLDIRTNCYVTKLLYSGANNSTGKPVVNGVSFLDGKSLYKADPRSGSTTGIPGSVTVTKEVILAAGAFNTPQLLKLSGIGPAAELTSLKIPIVVNLPGVGTNMQDRYEVGINTQVPSDFSVEADCTFYRTGDADPCLQQWKSNGGGAYGSNGFAAAIIKKSSVAVSDPDLFLFGGPVNFRGYYPNYADAAVGDARHWTWSILKAHTGNTAGTVTLKSTNPLDTPVINFNYFDTGTASAASNDLQALVEGVTLARKISNNLPLLSAPFTEVSPGTSISNTAQVQAFIKNEAWGHHASCTCPIGVPTNKNAVLDSSFRVYGVSGLRVVDASVFPKIPGFFIAVPIYMIAEKAADVIHQGTL